MRSQEARSLAQCLLPAPALTDGVLKQLAGARVARFKLIQVLNNERIVVSPFDGMPVVRGLCSVSYQRIYSMPHPWLLSYL